MKTGGMANVARGAPQRAGREGADRDDQESRNRGSGRIISACVELKAGRREMSGGDAVATRGIKSNFRGLNFQEISFFRVCYGTCWKLLAYELSGPR